MGLISLQLSAERSSKMWIKVFVGVFCALFGVKGEVLNSKKTCKTSLAAWVFQFIAFAKSLAWYQLFRRPTISSNSNPIVYIQPQWKSVEGFKLYWWGHRTWLCLEYMDELLRSANLPHNQWVLSLACHWLWQDICHWKSRDLQPKRMLLGTLSECWGARLRMASNLWQSEVFWRFLAGQLYWTSQKRTRYNHNLRYKLLPEILCWVDMWNYQADRQRAGMS